jgi:hypothetical protein
VSERLVSAAHRRHVHRLEVEEFELAVVGTRWCGDHPVFRDVGSAPRDEGEEPDDENVFCSFHAEAIPMPWHVVNPGRSRPAWPPSG